MVAPTITAIVAYKIQTDLSRQSAEDLIRGEPTKDLTAAVDRSVNDVKDSLSDRIHSSIVDRADCQR